MSSEAPAITEEFLKGIPKSELHMHVEGTGGVVGWIRVCWGGWGLGDDRRNVMRAMRTSPGRRTYVRWVDPVVLKIGPIDVRYYGAAYAIGLLTVDWWVSRRREHLALDRHDVADFSLLFASGALLGGRALDVAFYEWDHFRRDPRRLLGLWRGGMATHGVLVGAAVGGALFCRLRGKDFLAMADEIVFPGAALMALGRLGNHINGEVYGSVTDARWAMVFPYATGRRHPVALYDAAKNLLILPILFHVRTKRHRPRGLLLGHFVLWYGFLRFFVDLFRDYDSYWLGVGRGQYLNLLTAAIGLAAVLGVRNGERREPVEDGEYTDDREEGRGWRVKRTLFYALVASCLPIPSGWTQEALDTLAARTEAQRKASSSD